MSLRSRPLPGPGARPSRPRCRRGRHRPAAKTPRGAPWRAFPPRRRLASIPGY